MVFELKDINRQVEENNALFIEKCEKEYHKKVKEAADAIVENMSVSPLVLLSGPSGSGKTTTAMKLQQELVSRGINAKTVSLDNYYKSIDENYPRTETGELDFESPYCLDMELLNEHYDRLTNKKPIRVPVYDFGEGRRSETKYEDVDIGDNGVIIFEGIHALNSQVSGAHPEAFAMFVCVLSSVSCGDLGTFESSFIRLVRRTVRDKKYRGAGAEYTLYLWQNVLEGEKKYIEPFRSRAKLEIDSFLPYEINVLKGFVEPMFKSVPRGSDLEGERLAILSMLEKFPEIKHESVPSDSLLREFIGGGIYSY